MAYTAFDPALPDGSFQNGAAVVQSINDNAYAAWTAIAMGMLPNWSLVPSGGTAEQPTQFLFDDGNSPSQQIKGVVTWGTTGGQTGNITQIVWTVSQAGAAFDAVCTQVFTYDVNGYLTGSSGGAGIFTFFAYLLGRVKAQLVRIVALEALFAGLGNMSLQDASAVSILGGTVLATLGSSTVLNPAWVKYMREKRIDLGGGTPANTFTLDFAAGGTFICAPGNNFTFAINNAPPTGLVQKCVVIVVNAAGFTSTLPAGYSWGGAGEPVWTSGIDVCTVLCVADATNPVKRFMLSSYGP